MFCSGASQLRGAFPCMTTLLLWNSLLLTQECWFSFSLLLKSLKKSDPWRCDKDDKIYKIKKLKDDDWSGLLSSLLFPFGKWGNPSPPFGNFSLMLPYPFFSYASSSTLHPRRWVSQWVVVSTSVASRLASLLWRGFPYQADSPHRQALRHLPHLGLPHLDHHHQRVRGR